MGNDTDVCLSCFPGSQAIYGLGVKHFCVNNHCTVAVFSFSGCFCAALEFSAPVMKNVDSMVDLVKHSFLF